MTIAKHLAIDEHLDALVDGERIHENSEPHIRLPALDDDTFMRRVDELLDPTTS